MLAAAADPFAFLRSLVSFRISGNDVLDQCQINVALLVSISSSRCPEGLDLSMKKGTRGSLWLQSVFSIFIGLSADYHLGFIFRR